MGEPEGQITPGAAAATEATHQQAEEGMETLLGGAEMANAQQLQRPFVDGIEAGVIAGLGFGAEAEGGEGFHADAFAAEAVGAQLITRLKEGQGHAFGFLAGAVDAGDSFEDFDGTAAGAKGGIKQHGLAGRHPHAGQGLIGQETEAHGTVAIANDSQSKQQGCPFAIGSQ